MASGPLAQQPHCCIVGTPRCDARSNVVYGWVAQLAEQWTENPRVGGSIPPPAIAPFSEVKYEGKRDFFGSHLMWPEMKENEGLGGLRRHAVSCNFLETSAQAPRSPQSRFDCPDDAQVAGMRLRLASNFLTIPAPSPCVFFENWTRSQAMWQSQHLPLPRGSF